MSYKAWFQCSEGCDERYELNEIIYNCKKCGNLLEVRHDIEKLKHRGPESWMRLFDERNRRTKWPYGSSIWGRRRWFAQMLTIVMWYHFMRVVATYFGLNDLGKNRIG